MPTPTIEEILMNQATTIQKQQDAIMQQAVAIREALAIIAQERNFVQRLVVHAINSDIDPAEDEDPDRDHPGASKPSRHKTAEPHDISIEPALHFPHFDKDYV